MAGSDGAGGRGERHWKARFGGTETESYLRVEVANVGGGILVALSGVLAQQVGAHAGRDARRHG